jgi:hypothetical protein
VRNRVLLADVAIAAVVAIVVLVITPGLAIAGVLALLVLAVLGVSWLVSRWRQRARRYDSRHRSRPRGRTGLRH